MAENMEWEKEAPTLANLNKENPFIVPSNYFDELTERVQQSVFIDSLKVTENEGFSVPPKYFDTLADHISSSLSIDEYKTNNDGGFTLPSGYFKNLEENIITKTSTRKTSIKIWHQPFFKYAVAACLVAAPMVGFLVNQQSISKEAKYTARANDQLLYDIDESVIEEFIVESQQSKPNKPTEMELESYILDNFSAHELSNNL